MRQLFLLLFAVFLMGSCDRTPTWEFSGCDDLDPAMCTLPWPSSYHLRHDDQTPTGWRVALKEEHLPVNVENHPLTPTFWNERDGFSIGSPMLAAFGDTSLEGMPTHVDIAFHTDPSVRSILIDTVTGERLPHWVEVDSHAQEVSDKLTMLWPIKVLEFDRRYIVAYRGLKTSDGADVPVSAAFASLRDGVALGKPDVDNRQLHYDTDIFPVLQAQGFERGDLTLAWDFHTSSREAVAGKMEHIRDDAMQRVGGAGPAYEIVDVQENECEPGQSTWRSIRVKLTVPYYTETPGISTVFSRGPDGMPMYMGDRQTNVLVRIPCSLKKDPGEAFLMQYGHGLLGDENEAKSGWLNSFADENRIIIVAAPFTGMSSYDYVAVALMLVEEVDRFAMVPERSQQGLMEQVLVMRAMLGDLGKDDVFKVDGVQLINQDDVNKRGWYGISQGAILGGAYLAMSPDIERGVLSVGGLPYALLLPRSASFGDFFKIINQMYENPMERMFIIEGMLIQLWDSAESTGWSHDIVNSPSKRVLLQTAVGDALVTHIGGRAQARSMGASLITPKTREVYGILEVQPPFEGNGYVEFDFSLPDPPFVNQPPPEHTDPHECPRRSKEGQQQVAHFLKTGIVDHFCDGPCVTTRDNCH
ncbi:MAG: hypothetical protein ACI9MC_002499 [Kiritimatiellia bacterium]|jgi:hypothetical protein